MFDTVCKFLIETFPADFATWLLGKPIHLTELSPSELSLEPIRADALILLQAEDLILHLEAQTKPDPEIPFRMLDYRVRSYRRYPDKAMKQVVIYLKPSRSPLVSQTLFSLENTQHKFEVVRLWEQPLDTFLNTPGLLPFAVLSKTNNREAALLQVADEIDKLPAKQAKHVAASAYILSGLVLEQALIESILMRDILEESVTYQSIKNEGWQEGRQEGIQQRIQQERKLLLRLLILKIGDLPESAQNQIETLSVEKIDALSDAAMTFNSPGDLIDWLKVNS